MAWKHALANAVAHSGKASARAVLGKLIAELSEARSKIDELSSLVEEVIVEVNELSSDEQMEKLQELGAPEKLVQKKKHELPELPDAEKYRRVTTRFAPNPNGPLHIGHVRAAFLSYEYARRYNGEFILRFEDTNPANAMLEMYDFIRKDLEWLDIEWDKEYIQSDRLEIYYEYAEQLLKQGKAYVCICDVEKFRHLRDSGEPCECREQPSGRQIGLWQRMLAGEFGEEQGVMRIKTDINHPNPAVRDWPAFRVVKTPHPRVGGRYNVWPLYNFSVSIDDHEMGVTHVIRGKEHVVNEMRQRTLFEHFGWDYPTAVQYGRLNLAGVDLSKTKTMQSIESGAISGYDDVRLGTIAALRRRGFVPEAIRQMILDVGPTPVDASLSWESLIAYNRKFVDDKADRYFFVANPVELQVQNVPEIREVKIRLHPSHQERGKRSIPLEWKDGVLTTWIAGEDAGRVEERQVLRLKDLMNITIKSRAPMKAEFHSFPPMDVPKIQWVSKNVVGVEILKPDASREFGLAEPAVSTLEVGAIIQFERYGFVRIEALEPKIVAVYGHR